MPNNTHKVVRCANCGLRFMLTAEDAKCRFCKTEYVEVEEKPKVEEKPIEKKETKKARKEPFKIW